MILEAHTVSALLRGDPALAEQLANADRHHLLVIVIGEYRYGLMRSRHPLSIRPEAEAEITEAHDWYEERKLGLSLEAARARVSHAYPLSDTLGAQISRGIIRAAW